MASVEGSENRINVARQRYNDAARNYNSTAQSFPVGLARPLLGFPPEIPYFEASPGAEKVPKL